MKHYRQLTGEQRYQISGLKKAGWKQARIAGATAGGHSRTHRFAHRVAAIIGFVSRLALIRF